MLPGWNARRRTTRWAARTAWAGVGVLALLALASTLVRNTELAEFVEPTREGFPVDGTPPPATGRPPPGNGTPNDTLDAPSVFDEGGAGSGRRTEPRLPG